MRYDPPERAPKPVRQVDPVFIWPVPEEADKLFWVEKDMKLPKDREFTYGQAYWDAVTYPDHKLVYVSPQNEDNISRWFFASDRTNEGKYNWRFENDVLLRTYLVPRNKYRRFTAAEAAAATPPTLPGEFLAPEGGTADAVFSKYKFFGDTVQDAPEELKSTYIFITRRYDRSPVSDVSFVEEVNGRMTTTMTLVPATWTAASLPSDSAGTAYELQDGNSFHKVRVARSIDSSAFSADADSGTIRTRIDFPRELLGVEVIWNTSYSIGTQDYSFAAVNSGDSFSFGKSASDSASSSAAVTPEIKLKWRDVPQEVSATQHEVWIAKPVTTAKIEAAVGASAGQWPLFKPEAVTIATSGQSVRVRSNVQVSLGGSWNINEGLTSSSWDKGTSDDYGISLSVGTVTLPPCIHGAVSFTGDTARTQSVAATAFMGMTNTLLGTISATLTKTGTAEGSVSPTSLEAVEGETSIPTSGVYLLDHRKAGDLLGYEKIVAVTFNAASLA